MKITKHQFYAWGGVSNPELYRRMSGGRWKYFRAMRGYWS